jgi:hypothetical protein
MPQFELLVDRFVSQPLPGMPSQLSKPALHAPRPHMLLAHAAAAFVSGAHALPHVPQLAVVMRRSVSQPSPEVPLQSAKLGAHAPRPHAPPAHAADACGGAGHAWPHVPQSVTVVRRSVSQPLGMPSQSPKPVVHA